MVALRRDDRGQSRLGVIIVAILLCGSIPAALWVIGGWHGFALVAVGIAGWVGFVGCNHRPSTRPLTVVLRLSGTLFPVGSMLVDTLSPVE